MPTNKKIHENTLNFPKGFLWGTATAAHQVEGNNTKSDWWAFEQTKPPEQRSGLACNQYELYEEDFELAKNLGHNSHRLSIEWSRIEPKPGEFDQKEINHYKKVLKALKDRNIQVMLTLWHVTLPLWLAEKGGWENFEAPKYFNRFVEKVVPEIKDFVDLWITVNEPGAYSFMTYLGGDHVGRFPPGKKSIIATIKSITNIMRAHKRAYRTIHKLVPDSKVGIAQDVNSFDAFSKHSISEQAAVTISDFFSNHSLYLLTKKYHDFIGINFYFHRRYRRIKGIFPELIDVSVQKREVTDWGGEIYSQGLFNVLVDVSAKLPIYITECGIPSENDKRRTRFLITYLQEVYRALHVGVDVRGFFHWTFIDNFEWQYGFGPKFGLVEVNFKTQERKVRPSALIYSEIIKHNGIPEHLLELLGHGI